MKFTVLGSSGFVGRHLADHLRATGVEVFEPTRGDPELFKRQLGHGVYCIGLTADFRERPFATIDAHVSVLNTILERAEFDSLLYLSSTRVYARSDFANEDAVLSVSSLDPSDLYNLSKLTGESICFASGRSNVRAVRLSNVIGPDTGSSNFIYDISREALSGIIRLRTHPLSAKDYIGIDDLVGLLPKIAVSGKRNLYNAASGYNVSHKEWIDRLQSLTKCKIEVAENSKIWTFPQIDTTRVVDEFGFRAKPVIEYLPDILSQLVHEMEQLT